MSAKGKAMTNYILIRHRVKDFSEWKRIYDEHLLKRSEAGLIEKFLFRGIEDLNDVIIVFETEDLARARAFFDSAELQERMKKGGVMDRPGIYYLNEQPDTFANASGF
jgi:hypothetical protein